MRTNYLFILLFLTLGIMAQNNENEIPKNNFSFSSDYFSTLLRNDSGIIPFIDQLNKKSYFIVSYERRFHQDASYGIHLMGSFKKLDFDDNSTVNANNMGVGISINYDWSRMLGLNTTRFDIITGLGTSINYYNDLTFIDSNNPYTFSLDLGYRIRLNYWFKNNFGVGVEMNNFLKYGIYHNSPGGFNVPKFISLNYRF